MLLRTVCKSYKKNIRKAVFALSYWSYVLKGSKGEMWGACKHLYICDSGCIWILCAHHCLIVSLHEPTAPFYGKNICDIKFFFFHLFAVVTQLSFSIENCNSSILQKTHSYEQSQQSWVRSQHPRTQWNLRDGR